MAIEDIIAEKVIAKLEEKISIYKDVEPLISRQELKEMMNISMHNIDILLLKYKVPFYLTGKSQKKYKYTEVLDKIRIDPLSERIT